MSFNPPQVRLRFPLVTGETWEWEGDIPGVVGKVTFKSGVVAGEEAVEVPAGKFKTIKVVTTGYKTADLRFKNLWGGSKMKVLVEPIFERTTWLAKDVGKVKETFEIKNHVITSTLTKYSPAK